jgi:hypothetical protein
VPLTADVWRASIDPPLQAAEAAAAAVAGAGDQQAGDGSLEEQRQQSDGGSGAPHDPYAGNHIISLNSHLAARARRPGRAAGGGGGGRLADDWGEEPLGDDLLPM